MENVATDLSGSVWNALADLVARSQSPREVYFARVTKADKTKNLIWTEDFGGLAIPLVSLQHNFAYYDTVPTSHADSLLDYVEPGADVTVSGTSGAQTTVATSNTVTLDGSTPVWLELFSPQIIIGASDFLIFEGYDNGTSIGQMGIATGLGQTPTTLRRKLTPAAGDHVFTVKAYRGTANGTVVSRAGGAGTQVPSYLAVSEAVTTKKMRRDDPADKNPIYRTFVVCPKKGDTVIVLDPFGARRFPICIGVIQSKTGFWEGE